MSTPSGINHAHRSQGAFSSFSAKNSNPTPFKEREDEFFARILHKFTTNIKNNTAYTTQKHYQPIIKHLQDTITQLCDELQLATTNLYTVQAYSQSTQDELANTQNQLANTKEELTIIKQ
jgi:hypothetical protein